MADWDPFAVDDSAAQPQSAAKEAPTASSSRLSEDDLDKLAEAMGDWAYQQTPWTEAPHPEPDLSWYVPTCSFESWAHSEVKIEKGQQVLYVSIDRPDANNMISDGVVAGLMDAIMLLQFQKDKYRMVIFSATGKLFCGGRDPQNKGMGGFVKQGSEIQNAWKALADRATRGGAFPDGDVDVGRILRAKMWHTLSALPQFSICLVNGSCMGEGLALPACCDMTIAVESAFFNCDDVQRGEVNALIAPYLVYKIGTALTKTALCTGQNFDAAKARLMGLVGDVVKDVDAAHALIKSLADVLTTCGPRSVEQAKNLVTGVAGQVINEPISFFTAAILAKVTVSAEAKDGMICVQSRAPKPWELDDTKIICK